MSDQTRVSDHFLLVPLLNVIIFDSEFCFSKRNIIFNVNVRRGSGAMEMFEEKFPDCFYRGAKDNFFCKSVCFVIKRASAKLATLRSLRIHNTNLWESISD